jgi:hypothetical protein
MTGLRGLWQEAKDLPHSHYFLGHIMLSWQSVTASRVECNVHPKPRHRIRTITFRLNDNPYKRWDGRCKPNFGEWSTTCVPRNYLIALLYRLYMLDNYIAIFYHLRQSGDSEID